MNAGISAIGKYDILDVIGRGGMGVVYKAIDRGIGRHVAIKMVTHGFEESPDLLRRFSREAQSAGMLQHPNIVIVYELGDHEGAPFLVMEYLDGEPLDKIIANRLHEVGLIEKLDIVIQCCEALRYAHRRGVTHRDVKPANVVVLKDGAIKLVDFGIARIATDAFTRTGQVIGTMAYMSPEQLNGAAVDNRTDIFSLSVLAYELLTGIHPFGGKDTATTIQRIVNEPPPPLDSLLSDYPRELEEILLRGISKDREERYANAGDMGFDLARVQETVKRQRVNQYVERARELIAKSDHEAAKEALKQVISLDSQHETARRLLGDVQQALQREHRQQQAQTLRRRAEEAAGTKCYDEALLCLEQALALDKDNAELLAIRARLQDEHASVEQQQKEAVGKAVSDARSALDHGDLETALGIIQSCRMSYGDCTELRRVVREIERQRAAVATGAVERAIRDAEALLMGQQTGAATSALEGVAHLVALCPAEAKAAYEAIRSRCAESALPAADPGLDKTMIAGSHADDEAGEDVTGPLLMPYVGNNALEPKFSLDAAAAAPAVTPERGPQLVQPKVQPEPPEPPPPQPRRLLRLYIAAGLLMLLAIAYAVYAGYRVSVRTPQATEAVAPHPGYLFINAVPWATVKEVVGADGRITPVNQPTPIRLNLPPGEYVIHLSGPAGQTKSDKVSISASGTARSHTTFEVIDVEKLLNTY